VVSEACFLVGRHRSAVMAMIASGAVELSFRLSEHVRPTQALMAKYSNVPMALADACLVRMAELDSAATVITCDSDFAVYRARGTHRIPLLAP
jgi:predicted nucleic acid-binding protein